MLHKLNQMCFNTCQKIVTILEVKTYCRFKHHGNQRLNIFVGHVLEIAL
jgi:hypothetical protein